MDADDDNKSNSNNNNMVTLTSLDDVSFELPVKAAIFSNLLKELGDDGDGGVEFSEPVDLVRVRGVVLEKVVEFLKHHQEEPMVEILIPLQGNSVEEVVQPQWYQEFVSDEKMPMNMLFQVLTAANYLHIQPLLDLACLKVTFSIQGKDAEEIRQILHLPELTPEEEAQAREQHAWIFEES